MILQCPVGGQRIRKSGNERHHQRSTGRSFKPGAVAIDPLARRRDRLTAIGRRRSDIAKKEKCLTAIGRRRGIIAKKNQSLKRKSLKRNSIGRATLARQRIKTFVSKSQSERVSGSVNSQQVW